MVGQCRSSPLKVAAVQLNSTDDQQANLEAADRLTREAAAAGAELIVLPEKWPGLAADRQMRALAQGRDGQAMRWAAAAAAELGVELIAGSLLERLEDGGHANTCAHFDGRGRLVASYRKIHMFDVEIDGRCYRESALEQPGEEIVTSACADGTVLGLAICYDLRFPEQFRILALSGAQILTLPAAFTLPTTRDHWQPLLRARAIENQCFVVAANQFGEHPGGMRSGGRSMIVDPWGVVLAQAPDRACFILAEVDLAGQAQVRKSLPALANRRPGAYRWPTGQERAL